MNTKKLDPNLTTALANIPTVFRSKLIQAYLNLKKNATENRYDAAGLAASKLCEVVLRLLQQKINNTFTQFGTKINNYTDECTRLTQASTTSGNESERIVIPRALLFLYTMRNKRGIGHIGGDVNANGIDTATIVKTADWIVCELIRINHGLSLEEAQDIVDGISIRQLPIIWEVVGKKRVLKDGLKAADQVLLLLYSSTDSTVLLEDLCDWVEYSNPHQFKSVIIKDLHKKRLLEFDADTESLILSPKGAKYVEEKLIKQE